jgi:hypothetical protein
MTTIPHVIDGALIETNWGNLVADEVNSHAAAALYRVGTDAQRLALTGVPTGMRFLTTDTRRDWAYLAGTWALIGGALPYADLGRAAVLALASGPPTAFDWTDEFSDIDALHGPSNLTRVTIPAGLAGRWRFTYWIRWEPLASAQYLETWIRVNAAADAPANRVAYSITGDVANTSSAGSCELVLATGAFVELIAVQGSSASAARSTNNSAMPRLQVQYVGPS